MVPTHGSTGPAPAPAAGARVVADVGGTNARFATVGASASILERIEVVSCADYPQIDDAIGAWFHRHGIEAVAGICIAVAGPVDGDVVDLPNSHWRFSRAALETALGAPLIVLNDFTAQALCVDLLQEHELTWFGAPRPANRGFRAVIGPGTGLGVAVQTPGGEIVPSEGGHVGFAPTSLHQTALLNELLARYGRVSIERVLSGPGLENLYWANARLEKAGAAPAPRSAPEIARLAHAGDTLARQAVADFFDVLAAFAGDMALMAWATAGVYLSGGVLAKLMPFFDAARFRDRFEDKGRFRAFCASVPIARITAEHPGLLGCSAALAAGYGSA